MLPEIVLDVRCFGHCITFRIFFLKFLKFSETLDMSSQQTGEMYEGDSVDTCAGKSPLMLMGG